MCMVEFCIINGTFGLPGHLYGNPRKVSVKTWTISQISSKWHSVWTFSSTICVDRAGDEPCGLVEITRVKFMEA